MNAALLTLAIMCPDTVIVNKTTTWTDQDKKTLEFVKKRCEHFYPKSPCVKKFIKKAERNYQIICNGGRNARTITLP